MRRELDTLFDRFFGRWPLDLPEMLPYPVVWGLKVEEKEKEVLVRAELPGFEPSDLDVEVTGDVLWIAATRKLAEGKEVNHVWSNAVAQRKTCGDLAPRSSSVRLDAAGAGHPV